MESESGGNEMGQNVKAAILELMRNQTSVVADLKKLRTENRGLSLRYETALKPIDNLRN